MIDPWNYLDPKDREKFHMIVTFFDGRLAEQGTIDWALNLKSWQRLERIALQFLLARQNTKDIQEPWRSAWQFLEESWSKPPAEGSLSTAIYDIKARLDAGDRSGALINAIKRLVEPTLQIEHHSEFRWIHIKKPKKPRKVQDVFSVRLSSGHLIDLNVLQLENIGDVDFLKSLANSLQAAVIDGLDIAGRLGWDETRSFVGLGLLRRVYYAKTGEEENHNDEVDAFNDGIAPSVKLLHAVVALMSQLAPERVQSIVQQWQSKGSSVFTRLWAAMARETQLIPQEVVASFLLSLGNREFWDLHSFPEIAELRAVRFNELDPSVQNQIVNRLKDKPPRNFWAIKADKEVVARGRDYWAARELQRIKLAGGTLPTTSLKWLEEKLSLFDDLAGMALEEGFDEGPKTRSIPPNPDRRYDTLEGLERLEALEEALAMRSDGWDDGPAGRAIDWINQEENVANLVTDFETVAASGDNFPKVWERFGWAHRQRQKKALPALVLDNEKEVERVLNLIHQLSNETISKAINGLCTWLSNWEKLAVTLPILSKVWHQLWPFAVEVTNQLSEGAEDESLSVVARALDDDAEPKDLDTLNTPVGKLVGVFLVACPTLQGGSAAFRQGSMEKQMRDVIFAADGQSGLIGKHRMVEHLPYFLRADRDWAEQSLMAALRADDDAALALWRAVARRTQFTEVLKSIGQQMVERANDYRLYRKTRRRLVFSLVVESLHAFRQGREPAVSNQLIQQMLRKLDDELRASAAEAIQQFINEMAAALVKEQTANQEEIGHAQASAVIFCSAAAPFLRDVWPQERALTTPGVSKAFADVPAASGEAFADAVGVIARFLVPFDCWSMFDYGLHGERGGLSRLEAISNKAAAHALLQLLDLTIGTADDARVPRDLAAALDQIANYIPNSNEFTAFRRLSTLARR